MCPRPEGAAGEGRAASAGPVFFWGRGQAVPHHGDGGGGHDLPVAAIAAQISGNVRRPNVTVYFAIAAAYLCDLTILKRRSKKTPLGKGPGLNPALLALLAARTI